MLKTLHTLGASGVWSKIGRRWIKNSVTGDHFHHFKYSLTNKQPKDRVDEFLESLSVWTKLADVKEFSSSSSCPVKQISAIQLAANNPNEDRFNIGLTQVSTHFDGCP